MIRELFLLLLVAIIGSSTETMNEDQVESLFKSGFEEYVRTGQQSQELNQALEVLQFPGLLITKDYKNTPLEGLACMTCNVAINAIMVARRLGMSKDLLTEIAINLCILLKVGSVPFCRGIISIHKNTFIFMFDEKEDLTSQRVCAVLLHSTGCKDPDIGEGWVIDIPPEKTSLPNYRNTNHFELNKQAPLKVLQLSDVHYDPNYTVGSNADCKEALCCQAGTEPEDESGAAGYWGDYRGCDTPWPAFINSLEHIMTQHEHLDYVYYTGDIVDHRVWETSIEHNTKSIIKVLDQFKSYFGDIPVFPILGNHEPHPVNSFSSDGVNGPQISTQWVFDLSAKEWQQWLPEDTRETILKGGYYTVLLRPGFRIVALNSNVCYTSNWWLIYDDHDPYDQLQWLVKILKEAEDNDEKVHILSHVPTADSTCWSNWGREYSKIIRRFANTITAQFNGHTHNKENIIYFDSEDLSKPVNVAFNGGSLTAFRDVNPNYVVYDVDPISTEVLDYELWIYDITETNKFPELTPNWYKLYSFKEAYGANSLKPADMAELAIKFTKDRELVEQYFRFKSRSAKPALDRGCNDDCHLWNLCYMVTNYHGETSHCEEIKRLWNSSQQEKP